MSEKFESHLAPEELAKHLRKPDGETGKKVGLQMNKGNKHICLNSYQVLNPEKGAHILEIGMGNGFYISELLKMQEELSYTGVDFSSTMIEEASTINKGFIESKKVQFVQASIDQMPFSDNSFDSQSEV